MISFTRTLDRFAKLQRDFGITMHRIHTGGEMQVDYHKRKLAKIRKNLKGVRAELLNLHYRGNR